MRVNLTKIEKMLNQEQKSRRKRLFSIQDIEDVLNTLEEKRLHIMETDPLKKKYLKKIEVTKKYAVSNSYKYRAYTTIIHATISKYGNVKINIYTGKAPHQAYGGLIEKFQEVYE